MKETLVNDKTEELLRQTSFYKSGFRVGNPWLEMIKRWLLQYRICVNIGPVDSWDDWYYQVLAEDVMSPFFLVEFNDGITSYEEALEAGIQAALKFMIQNKK
jgi:hypothetical protein